MQKVSFDGPSAGAQTYFVHLPKGYATSGQDYDVLYHLHGAFAQEGWVGEQCRLIGQHLARAAGAGTLAPMILVCPVDPQADSMWSDSYDGRSNPATGILNDLIPHIDQTYRTHAVRAGRVLQGFSMGGFGALTIGLRAPDQFRALLVWDGALHNWETLSRNRRAIASKVFASESYFEAWSPWQVVTRPEAAEMPIFLVAGQMAATRDYGTRFKAHLDRIGKEVVYYDSNCPHSMSCMLDELGQNAFEFIKNSGD